MSGMKAKHHTSRGSRYRVRLQRTRPAHRQNTGRLPQRASHSKTRSLSTARKKKVKQETKTKKGACRCDAGAGSTAARQMAQDTVPNEVITPPAQYSRMPHQVVFGCGSSPPHTLTSGNRTTKFTTTLREHRTVWNRLWINMYILLTDVWIYLGLSDSESDLCQPSTVWAIP